MQKTEGDAGALIAATLTQAEMSLRGGRASAGRPGGISRSARDIVVATYEFYLDLVTTGERPELSAAEKD